jgi:hypothetical protein
MRANMAFVHFSSLLVKRWGLSIGVTLALCFSSLSHGADQSGNPNFKLVSVESFPRWAELSPSQQKALLPLEKLWPTLEVNRKRKWLAIAHHFDELSESSQALAQERMREWAALSPLERTQARLNFAKMQQLTSDEKLAKWEAYQALSDEDKQKIPGSGQTFTKGAAVSMKPVGANKLTSTPVKKEGQATTPRIDTGQLNPFTLLPAQLQATLRLTAAQ